VILLAKHCAPEIRRERPALEWTLSARGRDDAVRLAHDVKVHAPVRIVTSTEPKARETGEIVGAELGVPVATRSGLHEHERSREPYFDDLAELHARIQKLFARSDECVFGTESGAAARMRFLAALEDLLGEDSHEPVLVVAHGTVISLAVAEANGLDGFAFWERFGLGDHLVLATPGLALREHVRLGARR
jgi:broad specificity phosphatase PhoE